MLAHVRSLVYWAGRTRRSGIGRRGLSFCAAPNMLAFLGSRGPNGLVLASHACERAHAVQPAGRHGSLGFDEAHSVRCPGLMLKASAMDWKVASTRRPNFGRRRLTHESSGACPSGALPSRAVRTRYERTHQTEERWPRAQLAWFGEGRDHRRGNDVHYGPARGLGQFAESAGHGQLSTAVQASLRA